MPDNKADNAFEVVVRLQMELGESPVWDFRRNCLHWVDIHAGRVHSWYPDQADRQRMISLDEPVGCVALAPDGLVAATASGVWLLNNEGQRVKQLVANPEWKAGHGNRFNDGRCDPQGRLWVGTLDHQETHPTAALYCWTGNDLIGHRQGLAISNGLAFSPDGKWLYHADSPQRRVTRSRFNAASGTLGEPQPWIDLETSGLPGVPDGATVDSEGYYWCALYGGGQVARFAPNGDHVASYLVPCPHPTMVAFGGADLKTLYVTTARQHLNAEDRLRWPDAGSLFARQTDVAGLREPLCQPEIGI